MNKLLFNVIDFKWYHYVFAVLIVLLLIYIGIVIASFLFMSSFKKKLKETKESISIDFYQMRECLLKLDDLFKDYMDKETYEKFIIEFGSTEFKNVKIEDCAKTFNKFEMAKKEFEQIFVNKVSGIDNNKVSVLFDSFKELSKHYTDMTQSYNNYIIGYNYWWNLFSTKWIKKLFKIKKFENLK